MVISFMYFGIFSILIIPVKAMCTQIMGLDLYSVHLKDSTMTAPRCRNMQEINFCHKMYFIKCFCRSMH